ncbi:MAG: DEAD/DEAH box helicase [Candidatus Scalindua sp.]
MVKKLYPDQVQLKREIYHNWNNGHLRQILGAACGIGKSVIATSIIRDAVNKGLVPIFVVNQIQLVKQAAKHLIAEGLTISVIQGENTFRNDDHNAIVASIQSLKSRRYPDVDLIILDEIHIFYEEHENLINTLNNVKVLGLTGTPMRKGLGKYFTALVRSKTTKELIAADRLTPCKYYGASSPDLSGIGTVGDDYNNKELSKAMDKPPLNGAIVENWIKLGENSKSICFPVNIAHSKSIVAEFKSAGIRFEHVDAYTDDDDRARIFKEFNDGDLIGLSSVGVLAVGFDAPIARCLIGASPTRSLMKFIQRAGRVSRKYEGKEYAIYIDHAGDISERHGYPHDFEIPDLDSTENERVEAQKPLAKLPKPCVQCKVLLEPNVFECPNCGHKREKIQHVETTSETLEELGKPKGPTAKYKESFARQLLGLFAEKEKGVGRAYMTYKAKFKEEPPKRMGRMKAEEPGAEVRNYVKSRAISWSKSKHNRST